MRRNTERLAWTVMLAALFVCCALALGVPYGTWWYVDNATVLPETAVEAGVGTVLVTHTPGQPPIAVTSSQSTTLQEGDLISTLESNAQGTVNVLGPDRQPVASLRIYEGTQITVSRLSSPRFTWSPNPHALAFTLTRGGARVSISPGQARPIDLRIRTRFGETLLDSAGTYLIEIEDGSAQVSVSEGVVRLTCGSDRLAIESGQDGTLRAEGCSRLEGAQRGRDILRNGDFRQPLTTTWQLEARTTPGYPEGFIETVNSDGQRAARFLRTANQWGLNSIDQTLDVNIRDEPTVTLRLEVRIDYQRLVVCGSRGTECPIMVRIEFEDHDGQRREWLQGFYAQATDDPSVPKGCSPECKEVYEPSWQYVAPLQWEPYESPNLIEAMNAAGFQPRTITSISIYASGHSYAALIRNVQLLVQD